MNTQYQMVNGIPRRIRAKTRRSENDMLIDILKACLPGPVGITQAIRVSNMATNQFMKRLPILTRKSLVTEWRTGRWHTLQTTPEGREMVVMAMNIKHKLDYVNVTQ